jgi:hypothetical protein
MAVVVAGVAFQGSFPMESEMTIASVLIGGEATSLPATPALGISILSTGRRRTGCRCQFSWKLVHQRLFRNPSRLFRIPTPHPEPQLGVWTREDYERLKRGGLEKAIRSRSSVPVTEEETK